MGLYLAIPLTFLVALIQTSLVPEVTLLGIRPNLVLLFIVSWVLMRGLKEGILLGLIGGLVMDASSGATFGITMFSLSTAILFAGLGEINVFRGAWYLKFMVILGTTLFYNLIFILLLSTTGRSVPLWVALGHVILPEMLLNVVLMPFVYGFVKSLDLYLQPQTVEL